jgi:oligopeptide transport system ATP-binding protein
LILTVDNLHVSFFTHYGEVYAVRGVSFGIRKGETVAIVGESGCGKSVTAQAILRLIDPATGRIKQGQVIFGENDLTKLSEKEMENIRGKTISMIFQDPMTALNPTLTIGEQLIEGITAHQRISRKNARERALEMLQHVGMPLPSLRMKQYPHQLSGGMRQRVLIAMALSLEPEILIADEPTTALDVTIQAQIMELLQRFKEEWNTSILLITHDLGLVAEYADQVVVMYAGKVVETGPVEQIFENPQHPYTWGLLTSMPRIDQPDNHVLHSIVGSPPNLLNPPNACPFAERCLYAMRICVEEMPTQTEHTQDHQVACWLRHPMALPVQRPMIGGEGDR